MISTANNIFHDTEVEGQILGCVLLDPNLIDEVDLKPESFFNQSHAKVFGEMQKLRSEGKPIIPELLQGILGDDWSFRAGELMTSVGSPSHITTYARLVQETAYRRRLRDVGNFLMDHVANKNNATESILERSETMLSEIVLGENKTNPVLLSEATIQAANHIDAIMQRGHAAGVMTGLFDFDHDMGGLFPGELIVLAARPGIGKTSLALQVADHVASKGKTVYFASLEMSAVELSIRLACSKSCVSNRLVRTGRLGEKDKGRLLDAMMSVTDSKLFIHDQAGLTVNEIRRQVRRLKKQGLALAIVDYLQLISPSDRKVPREQQIARMSKTFKELAREFSIPVLCLCQLNRLADGNEQPQLSHLRESGAIEQDADVVLFLAPHKPTDRASNNASLIISKNRNGETACLPLQWHATETKFTCPQPQEWTP